MIRLSLAPGARVSIHRTILTFLGKTQEGLWRFAVETRGLRLEPMELRAEAQREVPGVAGATIIMVRRSGARGGKAARIGLELPDAVVATLLPTPPIVAAPRDSLRCQGVSL